MFVKRFYEPRLAQASYLIGCTAADSAVVIDANLDVEQYIRAATDEGIRITHVAETHIHADFVSGSRELAARTGATLLLSGEGGPDWTYELAGEDGVVLLKDGDTFQIGSVRVKVVHTPGHTPEHLMFLITDTTAAGEPVAAVTGDFVFVGDVGRPDLLERTMGMTGSMETAARTLFSSLKRLHGLPAHIQIWPGHGAGSACGKGIGSLPQSTLGYERLTNWAFQVTDEDAFVRRVLQGQPDAPTYFAAMKRINKAGPRARPDWDEPKRLSLEEIEVLVLSGAAVVDTRPANDFAAAHIGGALHIPLNRAFTTWAGSLVPYTTDIVLIVDCPTVSALDDAVRALRSIALNRVVGYAGGGVMRRWASSGLPVGSIRQIDGQGAAHLLRSQAAVVLDVRSDAEWEAGHIPGAEHIPLGRIRERLSSRPTQKEIIVTCQGGARSMIAASVLLAHGFTGVSNLTGGLDEWKAAGQTLERDSAGVALFR